jgi:Xaa-Pro aminopeptidase
VSDLGIGENVLPATPVSQLRVPNLTDVNFDKLRAGRLARLQQVMKEHGLASALFFNPANIRYATGVDVMGVWTAGTFARYCVVPAEGDPVMFEYPNSIHVSEKIVKDVRRAISWQFGGNASYDVVQRWAQEIGGLLKDLGLEGEPIGIDKLDTPGFQALHEAGIPFTSSGAVTVDAREVKTEEEVALHKINGAIGDSMLHKFREAVEPGIREYELLAVLGNALLEYHGEFLFTRLVASGRNTNPWMTEAHDKIVMPGDLVGIDTDANGFEGYVIDVSRTFLCGDRATPEQKEAYRVAHECVTGMAEIIRPGMTFEEFCYAAPRLPEKFREQRYATMVHQAGLEDEGPGIPYPDDVEEYGRQIPQRQLQENMILCLECYAGEVGAPFGVKLEDQVVVTKDGCELLGTFPFEEKLLV